MNIVTYLTSAPFPLAKASNLQIMQMCSAFAETGVRLALFGRQGNPELHLKELRNFYDLHNEFEIRLRPFGKFPQASRFFQLQNAWLGARFARQHGGKWLAYVRGRDALAGWVAQKLGATVAYEAHSRPVSAREARLLGQIHRHARGWLVGITPQLQKILQSEYGFGAQRWLITPDGVDLARFTPVISHAQACASLGLPPEVRRVVYVGGLYQGRGLEELFHAMRGLPAELLVVGGRNAEEIGFWQNLAQQIGIVGVKFTGYLPPSQVPLYLQAADILAMPYSQRTITASGEDTTAFMSPLKLFEYMAAARPIVASDLPVLRNVLQPEVNALLTAPDDAPALQQALARLLENPHLAKQLASRARQDVAQYTWQARAALILNTIYQ